MVAVASANLLTWLGVISCQWRRRPPAPIEGFEVVEMDLAH